MAEAPRSRSALARLDLASRTGPAGEDAGVALAPRPFAGKISLRGEPGDVRFAAVVRETLGGDLPTGQSRSAVGESITLLRLGPDEWLIVCASHEDAAELCRRLAAALEGLHAAAIDMSSASTIIRLSGTSAQAVLQEGCSLDLDLPSFPPGCCARTRLANADVVLHRVADEMEGVAVFDILVPRSYAVSLWNWLEAVGDEYGFTVSVV